MMYASIHHDGKQMVLLPKLMGTHVRFPILSQNQGKAQRYEDFAGKSLKLLHPFPFAAPAQGHSSSHCSAVAH